MFTERALGDELAGVRDEHAPEALVLDAERDFESLPPAQAEELGMLVGLDPATYPDEWLPPDAPAILERYASEAFVIGLPGDGGVAWTRQTDPPIVFVKPRLDGSSDAFVDFLVGEALVQVGLGDPDNVLAFFGDRYPAVHDAATPYLDPAGAYQVAVACYEAHLGLATRDVFAAWSDRRPDLFDAWVDAGERLEPRLSELGEAVARGETDFGDAAELACSAVKHAGELPAPFDALDAAAYREHGADYAVRWAERTFDALA